MAFKRSRVLASIAIAAAFVGVVGADAAAQTPAAAANPTPEIAGGPYCGVYCVYAALTLVGMDVQFEELLEPKYVGSSAGSSLSELSNAVVDVGGRAQPMHGMTASFLRASSHPVILHVRRPGKGMPFHHWVLFVGTDGDDVRIVDPPNEVQLYPFAELLSIWDGVGLVVGKGEFSTWPARMSTWFEFAVHLLIVIFVVAVGRFVGRQWKPGLAWLALPFIALIAAIIGLGIDADSYFWNRGAVASVVGHHFEPKLPELNLDDVSKLICRRDVTLIDARMPADYARGHIPGAINLPIYAGLVERRRVAAGIPADRQVILYCQSRRCQWGEIIGADLSLRGISNVSLFSGGWSEWDRRERGKH